MFKRPRSDVYNENPLNSSFDKASGSIITPPENVKRRKLKESTSAQQEEFRVLDESIPKDAARLKTRANMIRKGKNTIGYDEYLKQVKKEDRKRIPEHPVTPNHTLDIPNRRWQGQVKAWRLALHRYDPKDLTSDFQQDTAPIPMQLTSATNTNTNSKEQGSVKKKPLTLKEEEMEEATDMGLQVEFQKEEEDVVEDQDVFVDQTQENGDLWNAECANDEDFVDFDDSDDDDLL